MTTVTGNGYTLHLGDCLDVIQSIDGIDAVISDPPYGIDLDTNYTRFSGGLADNDKWARVQGDSAEFDPSPFVDLAPVVILWGANNYANKLDPGTWLIWDKRYGNKPTLLSHAEIAWCNKGHGVYIFSHFWNGFLRESEMGTRRVHPTQKPVAVMEWCIEKYTNPGDTVLDPYMGSGTAGVACIKTGRSFIGIEIKQEYYDIASERIANAAAQPRLFSTVPNTIARTAQPMLLESI